MSKVDRLCHKCHTRESDIRENQMTCGTVDYYGELDNKYGRHAFTERGRIAWEKAVKAENDYINKQYQEMLGRESNNA